MESIRHRSSFDSRTESPRFRMSFDASVATHRHAGAADQLRASFDARDLSSRSSVDIKDVVRASFQKERSRSSVDARGESGTLRESPRITAASSMRYSKDPPRSSLDGRDHQQQVQQQQQQQQQQARASVDSPRLSIRIKDAVRAAVEGRLDSVRSSYESKESLRSVSSRSRETPRSSSNDSRLLVELRESPRLSRDAPRYSCDGRDVLRSSTAAIDNNNHSSSNNSAVSRETLRAVAQKVRESPRLSVDGRGGPQPPAASRSSIDERESPRLAREFGSKDSSSSHYEQGMMRSDMEGGGKDQASGGGEPRRRVPSLVARLMGLEDLPAEKPSFHQPISAAVPPPLQQIVVPQKAKPSSKESKLLKGLLQYNPRTEEPKPLNESRQGEAVQPQTQQQDQQHSTLKHMYTSRDQQQQQAENAGAAHYHHHSSPVWNNNNGNQESPRQLKLSPKQLGMDTMPSAFRQQEVREIGALRQKVVQAMPKQLTEAVLTVLKNADDNKRLPMSYADMENRLRQLRLRSSVQEHKTLRQILEAMQSKGLLNGASRPKEAFMEHDQRQHSHEEARSQQDPRYQNPPKQIMVPKPQEYTYDASNASKAKNLQELKKLGSRLHDQVFGSVTEENVKPTRPQHQYQPIPKPSRSPEEQHSSSGAPIVVMKPVGKQPKKSSKGQNPALLVESMPGPRSPQRGRENGGRTSPWGSPVHRPSRAQPGFGFGKESTGRFSSEEGAAFKLRRERILARTSMRDIQSEPTTPRSPKIIALPQSAAKLRSSSTPKDAPESSRHLKVSTSAGRSGESGRRPVRSTREKEETSKLVVGIPSRSQSNRDLLGLKKPTGPESEPQKEPKLRRSSSDGKMSSALDRELSKSTGPAEVTVLRNRPSMGKRVSLLELGDLRTPTSTTKRTAVNSASKLGGAVEKAKERTSAGPALSLSPTTPRSPRSLLKNSADDSMRKEESNVVLDHVRVTDGDATDQSNIRSPLVGLTNRLQSPEVGLGELEREGQVVRTPRAGILVKKIFSHQEDANLVADVIEKGSEQLQPSPISVLDGDTFCEEDVSPLALNKTVDGIQDHCEEKRDGEEKRDSDGCVVQQADTALQDFTLPRENCQQLVFLRESAKILPPQGQVKPLVLQSQAEKVYVRDILVVSGATMGRKAVNPSCCVIDTTVFDYLEEKQGNADYELENAVNMNQDSEKSEGEKERQVLDRRLLFDCVNDVLTTLLVPFVNFQPWARGLHVQPLRKRPTGQTLVQQLWDQLQTLPPQKPSEDICDSLYTVLQKDLSQPRNSWSDFNNEIEDIGMEIEKMIFKDLIEETLFDMAKIGQKTGPLLL